MDAYRVILVIGVDWKWDARCGWEEWQLPFEGSQYRKQKGWTFEM